MIGIVFDGIIMNSYSVYLNYRNKYSTI